MKKFLFFLIFSSIIFSSALTQNVKNESIIFDSLSIRDNIKFLASDSLSGRSPYLKGNADAANFIATKFHEAGLKPIGYNTSKKKQYSNEDYYNYFSFLASVKTGVNSKVEINIKGVEQKLKLNSNFSVLSFSDSSSVSSDLVFIGYGINAPELQYNDYSEIDVKGKIIIVMRYFPNNNNPHSLFAKYGSMTNKVRAAKENGAAGIIFISPPKDSNSIFETKLDKSFIRCGLPCVSVKGDVFIDLKDSLGRSLIEIQQHIDSVRKPASFILKNSRADITCDIILEKKNIPNVIGILPGTDPILKDEFLVIGGHFDHLGMGDEGSLNTSKTPAIHYGADDNASGTVGVMALADAFGKNIIKTKRTLVFICFNAEEMGLLGSAAIVDKFPLPLNKVVTMINMDMIGRLDSNNLIVQGSGTSPLWESFVKNLNKYDKFNIKFVKDGFGPSDHSSFYTKNIPVLFFFTGLHKDYHKPSDTWDKINTSGMAKVLGFVFNCVNGVDQMIQKPEFSKVQTSAQNRNSSGFKVYAGTIPDYAYDGKGLKLSGVTDGAPAQKAGVKNGDIIVKMNNKVIDNIYDYTDALSEFTPGDEVETTLLRGKDKIVVKIIMMSR